MIEEMNKQIVVKKKVIGGETRAVENHRQIQKKITILENQLDKALQRYNGQQTSNGKLRTQIDNLRKDRVDGYAAAEVGAGTVVKDEVV
jgi:hypothetical protein